MKKSDEYKCLEELVKNIETFISNMDIIMKQNSTPERGKMIAKQLNGLEIAKDSARFNAHGLNIDFRTGKARKV